MIGAIRALLAHALIIVCLFGPVVLLGVFAAPLIDARAELGALGAIGVYFIWIGARAGQVRVWADPPR